MALSNVALISIEDLEGHIEFTENEIAVLEHLIDAASMWLEKRCSRPFIIREFDKTYNGKGDKVLVLDQAPIVSITSVEIDDVLIDPSEYKLQKDCGLLYRKYNVWPNDFQNIRIVCNAGMFDKKENVDEDLKQLARLLITTWFYNPDLATQVKLADMSISYTTMFQNESMAVSFASLIENYTRWRI